MTTKNNRFSIKSINFQTKKYRQYFFVEDSKDIENKIFNHAMNFLKCSNLDLSIITQILEKNITSLCHKVNMAKYHLRKYKKIEKSLIQKYESDIKKGGIFKKGLFFIVEPELVAHEEAFLFQTKAALDFLIDLLNQLYRRDKRKEMKKIHTFGNKGLDVIKAIEKYIALYPDEEKYLIGLLENLRNEVVESEHYSDGTLNWLNFIIRARDTASHYQISGGSFQIGISDKKRVVIPPHFTKDQRISDAFDIAYVNLLIFIEDFIALLFRPYLKNDFYLCFTYETDQIIENAPKWYLILKNIKTLGLKALRVNPSVIKFFYDGLKPPMDFEECLIMHMYYLSFYK